ncbi:MAG: hypothetical protein ACI97P_001773, partial [Arcticibacterium sp.]
VLHTLTITIDIIKTPKLSLRCFAMKLSASVSTIEAPRCVKQKDSTFLKAHLSELLLLNSIILRQ